MPRIKLFQCTNLCVSIIIHWQVCFSPWICFAYSIKEENWFTEEKLSIETKFVICIKRCKQLQHISYSIEYVWKITNFNLDFSTPWIEISVSISHLIWNFNSHKNLAYFEIFQDIKSTKSPKKKRNKTNKKCHKIVWERNSYSSNFKYLILVWLLSIYDKEIQLMMKIALE